MRIFLQCSVQQGWEGMRLGSANNHIFHISDAYNTHLLHVSLHNLGNANLCTLRGGLCTPSVLNQFLCEDGRTEQKDVTSQLVFEALLQHPLSCGLVLSHSSGDREPTPPRSPSQLMAALTWATSLSCWVLSLLLVFLPWSWFWTLFSGPQILLQGLKAVIPSFPPCQPAPWAECPTSSNQKSALALCQHRALEGSFWGCWEQRWAQGAGEKSFFSGFLCHSVRGHDVFKVTGAESLILRKRLFRKQKTTSGKGDLWITAGETALAYKMFPTSTAPLQKVCVYMCVYACIWECVCKYEWWWMSIYPHILSSAWLVLSSSLGQASLVFKSHSDVTFSRRHSLICPFSLNQPASPGSFWCFPLYCPAPPWSAPLDRWQLL